MGKIDDLFTMKFVRLEHAKELSEHYHLILSGKYVPRPTLEQDELLEFSYASRRAS